MTSISTAKKDLDGKTKVTVILGTRPEAIKFAPVIQRLYERSDEFITTVVATAQHRELMDQALALFSIRPDVDLDLMSVKQGLPALTGRVLAGVSKMLERVRPHMVLVQGDTTTAFAGALAAFYQKIPVGHLEAGLRSYDIYSPFPEEINRRLTTVMAQIHFAPTPYARRRLLMEGVADEQIVVSGNTVVDALMHITRLPYKFRHPCLSEEELAGKRLVLITSHRRESWGEGLKHICEAVRDLARKHSDVVFVYPVHPNPVVTETACRILGNVERVYLIDPLDYVSFVHLMRRCYMILSDSGGLQEEAPSLKKPLLLLRNTTERPEAFDAGLSKIVGTDRRTIVREADALLADTAVYEKMTLACNPYGDGQASARIVNALTRWAGGKKPLLTPYEEFHPNTLDDHKTCQSL